MGGEDQPRPVTHQEAGQPAHENPPTPQPESADSNPAAEAAARVGEAKTAEEARDALGRDSGEGTPTERTRYVPAGEASSNQTPQPEQQRNEGKPANPGITLEDTKRAQAAHVASLESRITEAENKPASEFTYPNSHEVPLTPQGAEALKKETIAKMREELSYAQEQYGPMERRRVPEETKDLQEKVKNGTATPEDLDKLQKNLHEGETQKLSKQEKFNLVSERIVSGYPLEGDNELYLDLKEQINQEKISNLDTAWKEKAARGEDPSDELVTFLNKFNELNGEEPLTDREVTDLKGFLKDVYEGGVELPGIEKSAVRNKFKELGKMEAQIAALKETINGMKKKEGDMKAEAHRAEESYLNEKDPQERMRKLTDWRQKALRLEGYQLAINDQAARGRKMNIKRRQAAGYIHRQLGTRGLKSNLAFGLATFGYEMSDMFQDVTVDQVKGRFS